MKDFTIYLKDRPQLLDFPVVISTKEFQILINDKPRIFDFYLPDIPRDYKVFIDDRPRVFDFKVHNFKCYDPVSISNSIALLNHADHVYIMNQGSRVSVDNANIMLKDNILASSMLRTRPKDGNRIALKDNMRVLGAIPVQADEQLSVTDWAYLMLRDHDPKLLAVMDRDTLLDLSIQKKIAVYEAKRVSAENMAALSSGTIYVCENFALSSSGVISLDMSANTSMIDGSLNMGETVTLASDLTIQSMEGVLPLDHSVVMSADIRACDKKSILADDSLITLSGDICARPQTAAYPSDHAVSVSSEANTGSKNAATPTEYYAAMSSETCVRSNMKAAPYTGASAVSTEDVYAYMTRYRYLYEADGLTLNTMDQMTIHDLKYITV